MTSEFLQGCISMVMESGHKMKIALRWEGSLEMGVKGFQNGGCGFGTIHEKGFGLLAEKGIGDGF